MLEMLKFSFGKPDTSFHMTDTRSPIPEKNHSTQKICEIQQNHKILFYHHKYKMVGVNC